MFIAFDGIDGSGKSTQVDFLEKYLKEKKRKYTVLTLGQNSYFKELINNISEKKIVVPGEVREYLYYFEGLYTNLIKIREKFKK